MADRVYGSDLTDGQWAGYWAYFGAVVAQPLAAGDARVVTVAARAGQLVMIGNAFRGVAVVDGADVVYRYSVERGYQATLKLQPGEGTWAFSSRGGTLTIRPSAP